MMNLLEIKKPVGPRLIVAIADLSARMAPRPIMNLNKQDRKGGVVSSCRDRGWGGADEGALCLSASPSHTVGLWRSERLGLQSGQAQGPLLCPHPPPVPTEQASLPILVVQIHYRPAA
jgi:hypothetical protein